MQDLQHDTPIVQHLQVDQNTTICLETLKYKSTGKSLTQIHKEKINTPWHEYIAKSVRFLAELRSNIVVHTFLQLGIFLLIKFGSNLEEAGSNIYKCRCDLTLAEAINNFHCRCKLH